MITVLLSMSIFALIGAITPGPVNIIATSSGATFGFVRTLPHIPGAKFIRYGPPTGLFRPKSLSA